jgi:serine/threonine protein kinase
LFIFWWRPLVHRQFCLFAPDESDYYRKRTNTQVPLKWMAPEAILEAKYTTKSDVWAFGVLGFEVTSFGMTPYGALGGVELMAELQNGYRLPQPPTCPPTLCAFSLSLLLCVSPWVFFSGEPDTRYWYHAGT